MRRLIRTAWRAVRVVLPHSFALSGLVFIYLMLDVVHVLGGEPLRWGWLPDDNFAVCALTLHHLPPADAAAALAELGRVARHGVLVVDLERSWPAYVGTWLWSRTCTANPLTRHDGPLSVLRAFTPDELRDLATEAGLCAARVGRAPLFRLALVARGTSRSARGATGAASAQDRTAGTAGGGDGAARSRGGAVP